MSAIFATPHPVQQVAGTYIGSPDWFRDDVFGPQKLLSVQVVTGNGYLRRVQVHEPRHHQRFSAFRTGDGICISGRGRDLEGVVSFDPGSHVVRTRTRCINGATGEAVRICEGLCNSSQANREHYGREDVCRAAPAVEPDVPPSVMEALYRRIAVLLERSLAWAGSGSGPAADHHGGVLSRSPSSVIAFRRRDGSEALLRLSTHRAEEDFLPVMCASAMPSDGVLVTDLLLGLQAMPWDDDGTPLSPPSRRDLVRNAAQNPVGESGPSGVYEVPGRLSNRVLPTAGAAVFSMESWGQRGFGHTDHQVNLVVESVLPEVD